MKEKIYITEAEKIWDKHFKKWVIAGQIKENALLVMEEYASLIKKEHANEWISVEDRLPEDDDPVLIYCGYITRGFYNGQDWYEIFNGTTGPVTYWTSLPSPPDKP